MYGGGGGGGGDRSPAGHPLMLFDWWGRSISVVARSRPEGGAAAGWVQSSDFLGSVLEDADQAVLSQGA